MTHEEQLKLAHVIENDPYQNTPFLTNGREWAPNYLALSTKLQDAEEERDTARHAAAEWRTKLAVKMNELQEVQAERDRAKELAVTLRTMLFAAQDERDELLGIPRNDRGYPLWIACPHCGSEGRHVGSGAPYCLKCWEAMNIAPTPASRGEVVKPQERLTAYDNIADVLYVTWEETDHAESIAPNVLLRLTAEGRVGGVTVLDHKGGREVVKTQWDGKRALFRPLKGKK